MWGCDQENRSAKAEGHQEHLRWRKLLNVGAALIWPIPLRRSSGMHQSHATGLARCTPAHKAREARESAAGPQHFCKDEKAQIAHFISLECEIKNDMFAEYIQSALEKAQYKVIDNGDEPYFVDVPELDGLWATGRTVEDARRNFIEALEDWIAAHLLWNLALPPISGQTISVSKEPIPVA